MGRLIASFAYTSRRRGRGRCVRPRNDLTPAAVNWMTEVLAASGVFANIGVGDWTTLGLWMSSGSPNIDSGCSISDGATVSSGSAKSMFLDVKPSSSMAILLQILPYRPPSPS